MDKNLKKITDLTINHLLNNDIILPSTYFDKFNYYARELEIDLDDESFKKEIDKIILKDFKNIENYMHLIMSNAVSLEENSLNAKNAILENDSHSLGKIHRKMIKLQKEIKILNDKLFLDDITNAFNKKWIYNKFLNKDGKFKEDGICVLIDVIDFTYVKKEYGEFLANNLLIFMEKFINQRLKDEKYNYHIVRYSERKFLVFILNTNGQEKNITNFILNFEKLLSLTTLKSNAGLYIKANYDFKINEFKAEQEAKEIFIKLSNQEEVLSS